MSDEHFETYIENGVPVLRPKQRLVASPFFMGEFSLPGADSQDDVRWIAPAEGFYRISICASSNSSSGDEADGTFWVYVYSAGSAPGGDSGGATLRSVCNNDNFDLGSPSVGVSMVAWLRKGAAIGYGFGNDNTNAEDILTRGAFVVERLV